MKFLALALLLAPQAVATGKKEKKSPGQRTFAELPSDIPNPERGMIVFVKLAEEPTLEYLKARGQTIVYSGVSLAAFRKGRIDEAFLARLGKGFDALRANGIKVLLRFTYSAQMGDPDAPKETVLKHIAQLKPLLHRHGDVIAAVQAGFIGPWGEWHGSTNGLDADGPRGEILSALLAAVPPSRSVQVRTPMFKRRLFGQPPLAEAEAFRETPRARLGHHNDAFLSDENDHGTFERPVETWKEWLAQDTRFTPFTAETFAGPTPDPAVLEAELARFHASFLHLRYDKAGLDAWEKAGVLERLRRRVGYRLVLTEATVTPAVRPGGDLKIAFTVRNDGFAAPFNRRALKVVLTNGKTKLSATVKSVDVRRWAPGAPIKVSFKMAVPSNAPQGNFRLALALPDEAESIAARPEYAIRFANADTWDPATGENILLEGVRISGLAPGIANSRVKEFAEVR